MQLAHQSVVENHPVLVFDLVDGVGYFDLVRHSRLFLVVQEGAVDPSARLTMTGVAILQCRQVPCLALMLLRAVVVEDVSGGRDLLRRTILNP